MNVSVVISLYNKVRHIRRAIESVCAQTYKYIEIIVIDDGSTDGSGDVVRQIFDPRLRLIVQANGGECAARNRGIQEATCKLVAFLDADDEWMPAFLETVLGLYARHPEAGMYATAYRCCEGERTWRPPFTHCVADPQGGLLEDYFQAALGQSPVWSSAVMIPKTVFNVVGLFPVGVKRGGDLHMWARIALLYRVAWSPLDGAIYHFSADNRACNIYPATEDMAAAAPIEEFLHSGRDAVSPRGMIGEYLVAVRLRIVLECLLSGRRDWARSLLRKTRGTKMFKDRRRLLLGVVWVPLHVLKSVLKVRRSVRCAFARAACSFP